MTHWLLVYFVILALILSIGCAASTLFIAAGTVENPDEYNLVVCTAALLATCGVGTITVFLITLLMHGH